MNNDWFFEKFALISDAPGAVEKMRGLVLDLAVQGKLAPQKQKDESATILLQRILSGSCQTAPRRSIRRKDTQADIEQPYQLPNNWTWTTLGTIADWGSGSTPSRGNPEFFGGKITWLKSGELNDNRALVGSEEQVTELAITKGSFRQNKPGDVLFAMYGATVGKAAILAESALTNQAVCGCTPCFGVLNDYLFFYLVSQRQKFRNSSEGGAQPNFSKDKIVTFPFPLPPLAEQKRIVAKVEELMGICDVLEAQQQERESRKSVLVRASLSRFAESPTPENLGYLFHKSYDIPPSELRKSILTLAVRGKLVPQDPNDEPAGDLLDRLELVRASIATKQEVRLPKKVPPVTDDKYPHELPKTWQWSRIGQLALVIDYGTSQKANNDPSGVPVYRMGNIVGGRLLDDSLKYVDSSIDDLPTLFLKSKDILFNRTNSYELVGKAGIFTGPDNKATFASYLIRIRLPSNFLLSSFFNIAMNAPYFRHTQIEPEVVQQCGQANFNGTKLASTIVPVPPLAEQHRIVAKVDQLMALVDELERQQETSREKASKLLDAIVQEMTSGGRDIAATLES